MTNSQGQLFIFEGPDGVGKTTLSSGVFESLVHAGKDVLYMSFPGQNDGTLGRLVYDLHHSPVSFGISDLSASSLQLLHVAAHINAIELEIIPTLNAGKNILLDRFWWSIWVYGRVAGLKPSLIRRIIALEEQFWKKIRPDSIFLIQRTSPINREIDIGEWHQLAHEYNVLAEREKSKYRVFKVANQGSIDESKSIIIEAILARLSEKKKISLDRPAIQPSMNFVSAGQARQKSQKHKSHIHPIQPTIVFDAYWKFAAERQKVFFNRFKNRPRPWTDDHVINTYKFTNAYRASDRVSQYLIRNVIYNRKYSSNSAEVFFRIMLFKLFNKIETWKLIVSNLGVTARQFDYEKCDALLTRAMQEGQAIYSAAYIMPSGGKTFGLSAKHRTHLKLLKMLMDDSAHKKIADAPHMERAFEILRSYPTIGDFLAYQFVTDLNYSEITNFSESEFVVPGPGARDGIRKCFLDRGGLSEAEIIRYVADIQDSEFNRLGITFDNLWGRPLQLIDCQNLFCEIDKYARVMYPSVSGISGRTRIKQSYKQNVESISYWYPPKWGINEHINK